MLRMQQKPITKVDSHHKWAVTRYHQAWDLCSPFSDPFSIILTWIKNENLKTRGNFDFPYFFTVGFSALNP